MSNPFKPIAISLLPNFDFGDVLRSVGLFLTPWGYVGEKPQAELRNRIANFMGKKHVILFESGRAAEYFLLKALGVGERDEVIVQAFTCVAVPNSVLWVGATPIYADIDESLNIDPKDLLKKITPNTKAVIVQHTFGTLAQTAKIKEICERKGIWLVEDLAHSFGNKDLGNDGVAAFLSFGRDKVITGIWGGAVVTNDEVLGSRLQGLVRNLPEYKKIWVVKQLLFVPLVYFILQTYTFFNIGKLVHKVLHEISLLPKVLDSGEKEGRKQEIFHRGMPGVLAELAMSQLEKLDAFVEHRRELAKIYGQIDENASYLRYSIFVDDPDGLRKYAAKRNVFLGDWYDHVVAPRGVNLEKIGYKLGSCPKAEEATKRIVNLPTNPNLNLDGAKKVINVVNAWKLKR